MPFPNVVAQLQKQTGLGRMGGAASRASTPIAPDIGSKMSAMQNAMQIKMKPVAVAGATMKKSRQFKKGPGGNFGQV